MKNGELPLFITIAAAYNYVLFGGYILRSNSPLFTERSEQQHPQER
jgi:hypothetical protein